jgi:hypothetical protein
MSGGTWKAQNKVQPGVYINTESVPNVNSLINPRGIVAVYGDMLNWGTVGSLISVLSLDSEDTVQKKLGYKRSAPELGWLQQLFLGTTTSPGTNEVVIYRPGFTAGNAATPATASIDFQDSGPATIGTLTATANSAGTRGNDITVVIKPVAASEITGSPGTYSLWTVTTLLSAVPVATQTLGKAGSVDQPTPDQIQSNDFVTFSAATGELAELPAPIALAGGTAGTIDTDFAPAATLLNSVMFDVLVCTKTDVADQIPYVNFVTDRSYDTGLYAGLGVSNDIADLIDYDSITDGKGERVTAIVSGFIDKGIEYPPEQAVFWFAGAAAGAPLSTSLTYKAHPSATAVTNPLDSATLDMAILSGRVALFLEFGQVKILNDLNTFQDYTDVKDDYYSKNQVVRVLDNICNWAYKTFSTNYISVLPNNTTGRSLFKASMIDYFNQLQSQGAIQDFDPDDIVVQAGEQPEGIYISVAITPIALITKVYMTVRVSPPRMA